VPKPTKLRPLRPCYAILSKLDHYPKKRAIVQFSGRNDGIGAQIHSYYSLAAFAALRNMYFGQCALANVAHNDDNDPNWDEKWNKFFNLNQTSNSVCAQKIITKPVSQIVFPKKNVLYRANKAHAVVDLFPNAYDLVMPNLRREYDNAPVRKSDFFETDGLKIAMHLRLGDASNHSGRASNIEAAADKLSKILKKTENESPVEILILSQGRPEQFAQLEALGAKLCLNTDLFQTFHTLVSADVLCMAKSSLSYAAALLNTNTVYYEPFWHPSLPHWKTL